MELKQVGPFRVEGVLGEGGMGVVYRATNLATGEPVALKMARGPAADLALFRQEIRALARLHHPQVVRIVAEGVEGARPWYAMELVEGTTLRAHNASLWGRDLAAAEAARDDATTQPTPADVAALRTNPASPWTLDATAPRPLAAAGRLGEVLTLYRRLCVPLGLLHGQGLVHRDLTPTNVLVRPDGTPVLMDLGVAARFRGAVGRERLEAGGPVRGTVAYMAPEQAMGQAVDARADLYALGCLLYESVTGRQPFRGVSLAAQLARVASVPPTRPSALVTGVPEELDELLLTLLASAPRQRLGYADDVARVLERLGVHVDDEGVPVRPYLYRAEVVGRRDELALLREKVDGAAEAGAVVLVGGESGVGKTCLVAEAARHAGRLQVVVGECLPVVSDGEAPTSDVAGAPFHPLVPLLQVVGDHCRRHGAAVTARVLGDRGAWLAPCEPGLSGLAPPLPPPALGELAAELVQQRVLDALTGTLRAWIADAGPVLLLLDDLHWADDLSLAWLRRCAREPLAGLVVVGTWRTEQAGAGLRAVLAEPGVARLDLGRLDDASVSHLVADMLALAEPPAGLVTALVGAAEGNPFFVAEYLRMAIAEGLLVREAGRWTFHPRAADAPLPEPHSLREVLAHRLVGLDPAARAVLEAAAVLGREFSVALLRAVHPLDITALDDLLRELAIRQILDPVGEEHHRFLHDKLREAVHAETEPARRRELHRRAAEALEAAPSDPPAWALLARHWREAEAWSRAVACLERAGEQAQRAFANREVIAHFEEALRLSARLATPPAPARLVRWERALSDAWRALGNLAAALNYAERALRNFGQPPLPSGASRQTVALLREVLALVARVSFERPGAARSPDQRGRFRDVADIYSHLFEPLMAANRPLLALLSALRTLNFATRTPPSPALARGYSLMSSMIHVVPPLRGVARRWSDRAVEVAEGVGSEDALITALLWGNLYYIAVGEWDVVLARQGRAAEIAKRLGNRHRLEQAHWGLAVVWGALGRFARCVEHASRSLASAVERGNPQAETLSRALLLEGYARLGRHDEAALHAELIRVHLGVLTEHERYCVASAAAIAAAAGGDDARAQADAEQAVTVGDHAPPLLGMLVPPVATVVEVCFSLWLDAVAEGRAEARALATLVRRALGHLKTCARFVPLAKPAALLWRGAWARERGHTRRARRLVRRALAEAQRLDLWHVQGLAWLELARQSTGAERAAHVARAVERFDACGAVVDRERALRLER